MLALVAILVFALLGFGAVAVDVGLASLMGVRLQTASDAVALACGSALPGVDCPEPQWSPVYDAALPAPTGWTPLGEPSDPVVQWPEDEQAQEQDDIGIWTVAQTVPLLFGHGSLISFSADDSTGMAEIQAARDEGRWFVDDPAGGLRESGIRVGGRSRVRFDRVVRIGRSGVPGRAAFGLSVACAGDLTAGEALELSMQTEGGSVSSLRVGSDPACTAFPLDLPASNGFELGPLDTSTALTQQDLEEALLPSELPRRTLYAPLADAACQAGDACTAVGFVKLDVERDSEGDLVVELTDDRAAGNASALCRMLAGRTCVDFEQQRATSVDVPLLLRAPVLIADSEPAS